MQHVMKKLAKNASRSTIGDILDSIRIGWNSYSFLLALGGASAILGSVFGVAGWASSALTVTAFYYAGEFRKQVKREAKKFGD
jgi:hypothetical protein